MDESQNHYGEFAPLHMTYVVYALSKKSLSQTSKNLVESITYWQMQQNLIVCPSGTKNADPGVGLMMTAYALSLLTLGMIP